MPVIFTKDTHEDNYLTTQEGKNLPIPHCIIGTPGHSICALLRRELREQHKIDISDSTGHPYLVVTKHTFGSGTLAHEVKTLLHAGHRDILVVVDMQNDFTTGSLGSDAAQAIIPYVAKETAKYFEVGDANKHRPDIAPHVKLIGVATDICVITNALLIKTICPEVEIIVDSKGCAGITPETHQAALDVMRMCQITVE